MARKHFSTIASPMTHSIEFARDLDKLAAEEELDGLYRALQRRAGAVRRRRRLTACQGRAAFRT